MKTSAIFLENMTDFENSDIDIENYEIFTFDFELHKHLKKNKIVHHIADQYLDKSDHEKIFQYTVSLYDWHKNEHIPKLEFQEINILGLFDTSEFHNLLAREIYRFIIIKRIFEKMNFIQLKANPHLSSIIKLIQKNSSKIEVIDNLSSDFSIRFEKYSLPFTINGKNLPIKISRNKYERLKNFFESLVGNLFGLFYTPKNDKSPIILVELNPEQYDGLMFNLKQYDQDVIIINLRKPAFWNLKTFKSFKKSNCKILTPNSYLNKNEKKQIQLSTIEFSKKLDELWNSNESFSKVFEIEDISIWPIIDEILLKTFKQRIREYLNLILFSNKIQREINPKCIISVNVFGETEKAILESNSRTSSILLEHAFTNYVNELSLYDISNMYPIFKDKIALWGQIQKNYLVKYHQVPDDRIILSGSPRHDMFFQNKSTTYPSKKPRILITLGMLDEQNAIFTTELFERFEHVLEKTFLTLKETNDSSFVVKLHPSLQKNNLQIKKFIEEFDQNIIIKQFSSIVDDIRECDIIINIFTEIYGSTVMLEGLIMEKPILNISLDTRSYKFEFENDNAVLGISYNDDIDLNIKKIINDKELRSTLVKNGTKHVLRYLSNPGNASKELARILSSF